MLTLEDPKEVISLCLTSFGLGYSIGCNKSQKQPLGLIKLSGCLDILSD